MQITKKWIDRWQPCQEGVDWFWQQKERDGIKIVEKLINEGKENWANWVIVRIMNRKQYIQYACFASRQILYIYEQEYPGDRRPRSAIEAAEKCISKDTKENRTAARAAWAAAWAAEAAAWATARAT